MSNNAHIPDICWMVHQFTELFGCKVDHVVENLSLDVSKSFSYAKVQIVLFESSCYMWW